MVERKLKKHLIPQLTWQLLYNHNDMLQLKMVIQQIKYFD